VHNVCWTWARPELGTSLEPVFTIDFFAFNNAVLRRFCARLRLPRERADS
jgi:hypothetical protein